MTLTLGVDRRLYRTDNDQLTAIETPEALLDAIRVNLTETFFSCSIPAHQILELRTIHRILSGREGRKSKV